MEKEHGYLIKMNNIFCFEDINEVRTCLNAINRLIEAAIINGGDTGGPYFSDENGLKMAMESLLLFINEEIERKKLNYKVVIGYNPNDLDFFNYILIPFNRGNVRKYEKKDKSKED